MSLAVTILEEAALVAAIVAMAATAARWEHRERARIARHRKRCVYRDARHTTDLAWANRHQLLASYERAQDETRVRDLAGILRAPVVERVAKSPLLDALWAEPEPPVLTVINGEMES